jgi:hypothetical protein
MGICTILVRGRSLKSDYVKCWYLNSYRRMFQKSEYFNRVYSDEKGTVIVPVSHCRRENDTERILAMVNVLLV